MYFTERSAVWLNDIWQIWEEGVQPLIFYPVECQRLAHGFIGCNLIIDLLEQERLIYANPNDNFAPGVICDEIYDWLLNPTAVPASANIAAIVDPSAARIVRPHATLRDGRHDPWKEINLWMFREAIVLGLQPALPRPTHTNAFAQAVALFTGHLTIPNPTGQQPGCLARTSAQNPHPLVTARGCDARAEFEQWWDDATSKLANYIAAGGWDFGWNGPGLRCRFCQPPTDPRPLCPPAGQSWSTCHCPLYWILWARNHQWAYCLRFVPAIANVQDLLNRCLLAQMGASADTWDLADDQQLATLDGWGQVHIPNCPPTLQVVPPARPLPLTAHLAGDVLTYLNDFFAALRGSWQPNHITWATQRVHYAEDIFSRRDPRHLNAQSPFGDWRRNALTAGT